MPLPLEDMPELEQVGRSQFALLDTLQKLPNELQVDAVAVLHAIVAHAKGVDMRDALYRAEHIVRDGIHGNLPHIKAAIEYAEQDL